MGLYITGDIHIENNHLCIINKLNYEFFPQSKQLTKKDYVIICGDTGLVWDNSEHEIYWRNWLNNRTFTTLFIDGNHENFNELYKYPIENWNGGKIHKVSDSIFHLMRGQVFNIDGISIFTFGGAKSNDDIYKKYRQEMPTKKEMNEGLKNLEKNNNKVDYIITHTCDKETLFKINDKYTPDKLHNYLDFINKSTTYKKWFFGHFHLDYSVSDNKQILFENIIKI